MKRREFLKGVGVGAAALAAQRQAGGDEKPAKRPNIVFLLTDDQRWDTMGCAGNKIIKTPNMDDMAGKGVMFTNAFVTTSICCTSRANIFTGQYALRHGKRSFRSSFTKAELARTYPQLLRQAGYRIGFIGKYGLAKLPADQFDVWHGFGGQGRYELKDKDGKYLHLTSKMGTQAIDFLRGCSKDKPFCLSISFKAPHVQDGDPRQFIYDRAYKDLYKDATIPVPETADPKYYESFPAFFKEANIGRTRWKIRFPTPEKFQESVKGYYRLITGVDSGVGRIRAELKKLGFDDNTVIILIGDNGFYLGEHGLAGKWYGHEESIRVPLVVYDPRLPADKRGRKLSQMALSIDIAPTILSLAGLAVPKRMQGRSLVPLLAGKSPKWRTEFFYDHMCIGGKRIPRSEGVVSLRYKYLRYIDQKPVYEELYDLKNDPHETKNLAKVKDHREILQSLRKRCDEYRTSLK